MWQIGAGGWPGAESLQELQEILFSQRGLNGNNHLSFLEPKYDRDIHNPYLFHEMQTAVDRIFRAVRKGEKIVVYGDYDADGITATAILVTTLKDMGANVTPFLPHRFVHGYGINGEALKQLEPEIDLLVTVDCGVSNAEELDWLKRQGKDTIIVDHHELPETLPEVLAVLHPRHPQGDYPFPYLSGAGMSWKLCQALTNDDRTALHKDRDYIKWLLDLALMGTVGDVVTLLDENRAIVSFGLEVMKRTRRPGLKALLTKARLSREDITAENIAWRLVSKINAAGRIDHPQPALDLLLAQDNTRAEALALVLEQYNQTRQSITKKILEEAKMQINHDHQIIFAYSEKWSAGVVGLAAGRLADAYGKPAIVVGNNGRHAVGSARSPVEYDILSILRDHQDLMLRLGGHRQAAGFSVDPKQVQELAESIGSCTINKRGEAAGKCSQADTIIDDRLINWETMEMLRKFEPFGEGNSKPTFVCRRIPLIDTRLVGKSKEHVKFTWQTTGNGIMEGIGFGLADKIKNMKDKTDILFHLDENAWMGKKSLQLQVKDIANAGSVNIIKN